MTRDELRDVLARDVVEGAQRLLGCTLVYPRGRARIVETEAYRGLDDPGCHAFGRERMKNMSLYGPAGHAYIYRSYGIHQMLNVVALPSGIAAGILIRALRPFDDDGDLRVPPATLEFKGPGRLGKALGIDESINGRDLLSTSSALRVEPASEVGKILVGPRIGLSQGKGESTLWRFVADEDLAWVSATRRDLRPIEDVLSPSSMP